MAEKEVVAYTEKRDFLRAEMVSADERLARLKDEVGCGGQDGHPVPNPQLHIPPEVSAELDRLRCMVANSMQVDHDSEIRRLRERRAPSSAAEGGSSPIHARVGPSRTCSMDGGPPGRSSRGLQFGTTPLAFWN